MTFWTDQKFEKFQMMPEATKLSSIFLAGASAAGGDVAGVCVAEFIARIVAATDAAVPFCGGTNLKQTNLRPSDLITGIDSASPFTGLHLSNFCHV